MIQIRKVTLFILIIISLLAVAKIYHFRKHLEFWIHSEISSNSAPYVLNNIDINCSVKSYKNFQELYKLYPTISTDSKEFWGLATAFYDTLNKENKWVKSKIKLNEFIFQGKIKIHGRSPWQHKDRYHFSIKVKNDTIIENTTAKKINLIVYSRIKEKYDVFKYISDKIGLYLKPSELSNVSINGRSNNLYFLETKNPDIFPNNDTADFITLSTKNDNSLIYTYGHDIKIWDNKLKHTIEKIKKSDSDKSVIYTNYRELNHAIFNNDSNLIYSYFDKGYISKLIAFIQLANLSGHGFEINNLEMAFNIKNNKFYPIIHRDNLPRPIEPTISNTIKYNFDEKYPSPLFKVLYSNKEFVNDANEFLHNVLLNKLEQNEINEIINRHQSYYLDTYISSFFKDIHHNVLKSNLKYFKSISNEY